VSPDGVAFLAAGAGKGGQEIDAAKRRHDSLPIPSDAAPRWASLPSSTRSRAVVSLSRAARPGGVQVAGAREARPRHVAPDRVAKPVPAERFAIVGREQLAAIEARLQSRPHLAKIALDPRSGDDTQRHDTIAATLSRPHHDWCLSIRCERLI